MRGEIVEKSYFIAYSSRNGIVVNPGFAYNTFSNNYIYNFILYSTASSNIIINNILDYAVYSEANVFRNNILITGNINGSNNLFYNNIGNSTQFGTENDNQSNVDMATVFVGYPDQDTCSTDGRWQLAPGSPAIGTGQDGVDCGMFGGTNPYVLSGLPNIPAIYFFSAPDSSGGAQILPVQIQGKVHK